MTRVTFYETEMDYEADRGYATNVANLAAALVTVDEISSPGNVIVIRVGGEDSE